MKAWLMHPDRDFSPAPGDWRHDRDLAHDLALDTLVGAMADGDPLVAQVARTALLAGGQNSEETIHYRQEALQDAIRSPAAVRELYALTMDAVEARKKGWWGLAGRSASGRLWGAVELLETELDVFARLRELAEREAPRFRSRAFSTLWSRVRDELSRDYLARVQGHLAELRFRSGILMSAELGPGNRGAGYVLRRPPSKPSVLDRLLGRGPPGYTFHIDPEDEAGARALSEMQDRGIGCVAKAAVRSAEHVVAFFETLRMESGFYVGCLTLHERLLSLGAPMCWPVREPAGSGRLRGEGLYDVCLALTMERAVVPNTFNADGRRLVLITGANEGGKSTFLRSVGLAQLMMQAGMFVGAESFAAELSSAVFTHYRREEDPSLGKGKLDEELARLSELVDSLRPGAHMLFNESFAATNQREGSEIARQVVSGLIEKEIRVSFVTHLYGFAHEMAMEESDTCLCLRAERGPGGARTFRLVPGDPRETSYGEVVYREVFGDAARQSRVARTTR